MLSLYKLEIFAAVVQAGSFSAAAQRLYMTQPAVSQHIQDLENSLGATLFIRGRRGVTLTNGGEKLYEYTQKILQLVAEAESEVTNVENLSGGQITIGATPGVSTYLLPEWLRGFRERYPQLNVALMTGVTSEMVTKVMEHQIDLAFVEGELAQVGRKGLGHIVLQPVQLFVIVGRGHDWCHRETVTLTMLNDQPFIMRQPNSRTRVWVDDVLSESNIKPRIVGEFDNQEAIKQAVMSNMGITILPDYAVIREVEGRLVRALPVEGADLQRELKLVYDTALPLTPIARALLHYLNERFPVLETLLG